jgi:hypothetical protein
MDVKVEGSKTTTGVLGPTKFFKRQEAGRVEKQSEER